MLLCWDRLLRYRVHRKYRHLVAFGLLSAAITLIHSFTALNTCIGVLAIILARRSVWRTRDIVGIALGGAAAFVLVAAWPYSSVRDLFAAAPAFGTISRQLMDGMLDPRQLSCAYGLLGLAPLLLRLRKDRRDPLVPMFGIAAAVLAFAIATSQYQFLRVTPVVMLPLHVALGAFVAGPDLARVVWRRVAAVAATVVLLAGLVIDVTPLGGFVGAVPIRWLPGPMRSMAQTPSLTGPSREFDFVRTHVPAGSTVLTDHRWSDRHLNWLGYFTVNPGWPAPWLGDESQRATDRSTFLRPTTNARVRGAIAGHYRARCVLITRTPAVTAPDAVEGFPVVRSWRGGALYCR
jgi:hypothetical protein